MQELGLKMGGDLYVRGGVFAGHYGIMTVIVTIVQIIIPRGSEYMNIPYHCACDVEFHSKSDVDCMAKCFCSSS